MASSKIAYGVRLSSPCKNCHNDDQFSKFVDVDKGQVFHSCGFKVGAQWCNGKPVDPEGYRVIYPGKVAGKADGQLVAQYFNHRYDPTQQGSPTGPAVPGVGAAPAGATPPATPPTTSGTAAGSTYSDLYDKASDNFGELAAIFAELAHKAKAAGR